MTSTINPGGPGRPKDPAKRQAILEAAKLLLLCRGYEGSSMDAIALEAGVSKFTVYSHFTDKETLFFEAVQSQCAELVPELYQEPAEGSSLEELLLSVARGFNRLLFKPQAIALYRLVIFQGWAGKPLSKVFFDAGPQQALEQLERLIEWARREGALCTDHPRHAAEHFLTLVQGYAHLGVLLGCAEAPDVDESERHVREVVRIFLSAYRSVA